MFSINECFKSAHSSCFTQREDVLSLDWFSHVVFIGLHNHHLFMNITIQNSITGNIYIGIVTTELLVIYIYSNYHSYPQYAHAYKIHSLLKILDKDE